MFMLPVQVNPSPVYPGRQVHVKLPSLLVQLASALQPPLFVAHSSVSALSQILPIMKSTCWKLRLQNFVTDAAYSVIHYRDEVYAELCVCLCVCLCLFTSYD